MVHYSTPSGKQQEPIVVVGKADVFVPNPDEISVPFTVPTGSLSSIMPEALVVTSSPTTGQIWPRSNGSGADGEGGGGTTILSGTADPTPATGDVGNYYLDTDNNILYGPKNAGTIPTFGAPKSGYTSQTPASSGVGTSEAYGSDVTFATGGRITALKVWIPTGSATTRVLKLWDNAGTEIGSVTTAVEGTLPGWRTAVLPSPITVTAGQVVRVSLCITSDYVAWTTSLGTVTNSPITIGPHYFHDTNQNARPIGASTAAAFIDVIFEPDAFANQWPVALTSPSANSAVILSGTATPSGAVGNVGNYYLDTDNNILYGPKAIASVDEYITPTPPTDGNMGNFTYGVKFRFSLSGSVTSIRVYMSASSTKASEVYLFSGAGAMLASKDFTGVTGWNTVVFDAPVLVSAGTTYIAAFYINGYMQYDTGAATSLTSGNVVRLASGVDGSSPLTGAGRDAVPVTGTSGTPGISPVFTASIPWPVALTSAPADGTYWELWTGTQAAYDAIGTKDPQVLYVVV